MKAIAILAQHPSLQALDEEATVAAKGFAKETNAVKEKIDAWRQDFWTRIIDELKRLDLIPADLDKNKFEFSIDHETGVITMKERKERRSEGFAEFMKEALEKMGVEIEHTCDEDSEETADTSANEDVSEAQSVK